MTKLADEKPLPLTAVWRNGGCSASYDSFVVGSSAVLRLNFCAKNPPLRQAANRCSSVLLERINLKPLLFRLLKIFAEILYADIFRTLRSELHNDEFCQTLRTEI